MTKVYLKEGGRVKECKGIFALTALEELVKRFPKKYRFIYRDNFNATVEVL